MTDLKERAIRAATERGQSNTEQLAAYEAVRKATVLDWLTRRLYRLMRRVLDTDMPLTDISLAERPIEGIDWTEGTLTAWCNGLQFGTTGTFGHDGRNLPLGGSDLLVWIPCEGCGRKTGPFRVGSLSGLGHLLAAWERCDACINAAATADLDSSRGGEDAPHRDPAAYGSTTRAVRIQVDPERMAERRKQGGGIA